MFRCNSHQFAGPTQLLPSGPSHSQAAEALASLRRFLDGQVPTKPAKELGASADAFKWREFRQGTKQLLVALANALSQSMPDQFNLLAFRPDTILKPCPLTGSRVAMTPLEKTAHGIEDEVSKQWDLFAIHDHKTLERYPDFISTDESFYKLTMSADEGTEADGLNKSYLYSFQIYCFSYMMVHVSSDTLREYRT